MSGATGAERALAWFEGMIGHCLDHATEAKEQGRPIVGILCEYTPRELIMAAGGVPVCLCGGSAETVSAAERELPSNLCPLIKSTYGYHVLEANPFLEMAYLVVGETTCDGKKKMLELLSRRVPTHVVELPQKPDDADARAHWGRELAKLRRALADRLGASVSDNDIREAVCAMNRERRLRRSLAELMRSDSPPLTGRELLSLKSSISCIAEDLSHYEAALASLPRRERADQRGRVRVLLTGVPVVHGAERVVELIEDRGGLIVCQENCTGLKPILDDVDESADDPMEALADKYFALHCSVMTPNRRRLDAIRRLATDYRPDCVIELIWQACLTYSVESRLVRGLIEDDLGLPYLMIETDYSPSDSERIAVRVEALFETVRARKQR